MSNATKFIGYTIGLECFVEKSIKSVSVEYSELPDGKIRLQAVSAHNLGSFGGRHYANISREDFDNRVTRADNKVPEAIWALDLCGLTPAALDR